MSDQPTLAKLLRDVLGPLMVGSTLTDDAYRRVADRLAARGVRVTGDAGLREAAQAVVDADAVLVKATDEGDDYDVDEASADYSEAIAALHAALAKAENGADDQD